jgi:hypothetical protein
MNRDCAQERIRVHDCASIRDEAAMPMRKQTRAFVRHRFENQAEEFENWIQ